MGVLGSEGGFRDARKRKYLNRRTPRELIQYDAGCVQPTPRRHIMERIVPKPAKVEIGFTKDRLTGTGGAALLAEAVRRTRRRS